MNAILAVLYAVALLAASFAVLSALLRSPGGGSRADRVLVASLTPGVAALANHAVTFLRLYSGWYCATFQAWALVVAAVVLAACVVRRGFLPGRLPVARGAAGGLGGVLVLGLALSAAGFAAYVLDRPEGRLDAWTQWNLKARYLWLAGENWRSVFTWDIPWTHPTYPVLLTLNVASFYELLGADACLVGIGCALCFTAALAGLLWSGVRAAGGRAVLVLAVLALSPVYGEYGARQQADIEVSYYLLAATVCAARACKEPGAAWAALACVFAVGAASTKNEGAVFLGGTLCAMGALAAARLRSCGPRAALRLLAACVVASAVTVWPFVLFKFDVSPVPFALEKTPVAALSLGADWPRRLARALYLSARAVLQPGKWAGLPLAYAGVWAAAHVRRRQGGLVRWVPVLPVFLMLPAYLAAYLTSPEDVDWLVRGSISRLLFQVWPAALFLLALRLDGEERDPW